MPEQLPDQELALAGRGEFRPVLRDGRIFSGPQEQFGDGAPYRADAARSSGDQNGTPLLRFVRPSDIVRPVSGCASDTCRDATDATESTPVRTLRRILRDLDDHLAAHATGIEVTHRCHDLA